MDFIKILGKVYEYIGEYIFANKVIKRRTIQVAHIFVDIDKHNIYIQHDLNTQNE